MSDVKFFRAEKSLKIEFKLPNDKYNTKVRDVTAEDIEQYAAEYQLFQATEEGTVALEATLAKFIAENRELKAKLAALEEPEDVLGELLPEAELEIEEELPKKGKR